MNVSAQSEVLKPPRTEVGLLGWLTKHLFSTWYNVLLTIVSIAFIYVVLRAVITWVVRDARWEVVVVNLKVFMIGRYPAQEAWRVLASLGIVVLLHLACFVLPYVGLALGLTVLAPLLWPSVLGVAANVLLRLVLLLRFRQPLEGLLLHPLAVAALLALAFNSYRLSRRGQLGWAGRTYASRSARASLPAPERPLRAEAATPEPRELEVAP